MSFNKQALELLKEAGRYDFLTNILKSKTLAANAGKVVPSPKFNANTFAQSNPGVKGLTLNKVPGAGQNLTMNFSKEHGSFGNFDPNKVPGAGGNFSINFPKQHPNLGTIDLSKVQPKPNTWFQNTAPANPGFTAAGPPAARPGIIRGLANEMKSPVYSPTGEMLSRSGLGFTARRIPSVMLRGGLNLVDKLHGMSGRAALGVGTLGTAAYTRAYPKLVEMSHRMQEIEDLPHKLSELFVAGGNTYNRAIEDQKRKKMLEEIDAERGR
jgi:hypothetical protein